MASNPFNAMLRRGSVKLARTIAATDKLHGPCDVASLLDYIAVKGTPAPSSRALGLSMGQKFYHGLPCKNCAGTRRYTMNSDCVACAKARQIAWKASKHPAVNSLQIDISAKNRAEAQAAGKKRYEGRECGECGTTERYVLSCSCCECTKRKTQEYKVANGNVSDGVREMLQKIADAHCVTLADAMGNRRLPHYVRARHEMWVLLRNRGYSFPRIAAIFQCDHSSVITAVRKVMGLAA